MWIRKALRQLLATKKERAQLEAAQWQEVEQEIAALVAEVPEFEDIFTLAREVNRDRPDKLRDIVRYTRWLLDQDLD